MCVPASCACVPASHMEAAEVVTSMYDDRVGRVVLPTTKFTNPLLWPKTQLDDRQNYAKMSLYWTATSAIDSVEFSALG